MSAILGFPLLSFASRIGQPGNPQVWVIVQRQKPPSPAVRGVLGFRNILAAPCIARLQLCSAWKWLPRYTYVLYDNDQADSMTREAEAEAEAGM